MINKTTHYINESSLCIDVIFSSNVNLTKNFLVERTLDETCHHNIIYRTLNFNILLDVPYLREIWDYKNANIECIQKSIYNFDWTRAFQNRNCNEKCKILSETLLNIFHNFIPHKIKKFDYKTPEWINRSIKLSLKKRSKLTKRYHSNPTANNKEALDFQAKECTSLIIESKERFIAKMSAKLDNPKTVPKTYWSIINKFLSNKKTPIIPPVLVNGELVSDFEQKANLFNNYFASQCTPIKNGSKLPNFSYKTEKILTSFDIKDDDILSIIKNLNVDKAHGWDQISIRMIKTCDDAITIALKLIFKFMINEGVFPDDWKKNNVVLIHKKESKNLIKNYRPISLLPIFSKVFEKLVFNMLFNFFLQYKLFTPCQSGFIPGDSCVLQLLSITHEIQKSFDCNPLTDMRGTFLP